ncbi:MAG: PKD domain-containing protein [Lewinellaceae bacterium]|nr:PKD domain-containing protein [Lewinellaceae bacterium]
MKTRLIGSLILFLPALFLFGQTPEQGFSCGHPALPATHQALQEKFDSAQAGQYHAKGGGGGVCVLRVVVHIVHQNGAENVPDDRVYAAIEHLNQAFAHTDYYAGQGPGVSVPVQFCLARREPDGSATPGIYRVESPLTNMVMETQDLELKNLSRRPPGQYINIWVVQAVNSNSQGPNVAGYAYLAAMHGTAQDGIVCEAGYFGVSPVQEAVLIHEIGHYLNLYHTFERGCQNDNCLLDGDRVCDTPPDQGKGTVCAVNTCQTDTDDTGPNNPFSSDQPDATSNFMDYSPFSCYRSFSEGQSTRMLSALEGLRESLLHSDACAEPCYTPLQAAFLPQPQQPVSGDTIRFENKSIGSTSWQWALGGTVFSTAFEPDWAPDTSGFYEFILTVKNDDPNCYDTARWHVYIPCRTTAIFEADQTIIDLNDTLHCTNLTTGADGFAWAVNGTPAGTSMHLNYQFPATGLYVVTLTASSGSCSTEFSRVVRVQRLHCSDLAGARSYGLGIHPNDFLHIEAITLEGNLYFNHYDYPDGALLKTDSFGNIIWKKKIDLPTNGMSSVPASDGGFFLALPDETGPQVRRFAKVDADGNIVWAKKASVPGSASSFWLSGLGDAAVYVAFASTNTYIERCYLLKINNAGDVLVNKVIDFAELGRFYMAVPAQNGGFWLLGFTHSFQNSKSMVALLFDSTGNIVLNRLHRLTDGRGFQNGSAVPTNDGGYAVCCSVYDNPSQGTPNHDAFVWRADATGTILWAKRIWMPTNDNIESSSNLFQSSDGDFHCRYIQYQGINAHLALGPDGNVKLFDRLVVDGDSMFMPEQFFQVGNRRWMSAREWNVFNRVYLFELDAQGKPARCGETIPLPHEAMQPDLIPDTLTYTILPQTIGISPATLIEIPHTETLVPQEHCVTGVDCPEICFNNLDDDDDGLSDCADPDCVCLPDAGVEPVQVMCLPDSLELHVRVCNRSAYPLPAGIPVAVYAGDPRLLAATPLGDLTFTPELLGQDTCVDLYIRIPTIANQAIFVAINDDRSQPTPYAVPPATVQESDYDNNFTSFAWSYQAPTLDLGPDRQICESSVQILTAGAGFTTYRWQDNSPDSIFTAFQPGVYWVDVWDACGSYQSDTIRISIQTSNSFDLGPDRVICPGDTVLFNLPAGLTALWEPTAGLDCPACTSVTALPAQSVTYRVTAALGDCLISDSVRIEVSGQAPLADFTFVVQPDSSVQFTDASQFAQQWLWDFGDGTFSSETSPLHLYKQEGAYSVILRIWNTCDTAETTQTVNWFFPPLAGFSVPDTVRACEAVVLVFENESSANTQSYSWAFPGGTPDHSVEENPAVTYTQTGDYSAILVAGNNLGTDSLAKTFRVEIDSFPVANFTFDIQAGGTVQFYNSSQFVQQILWDFGDGTSSSETNPAHTYTQAGEYVASLTVANFCGAAVMQQTIKTVSTGTTSPAPGSNDRVYIYPNPADHELWIDVVQVHDVLLYIQVLNTKGQWLTTIPAGPGTLHKISVADFPAGILFVRTQFDHSVYVHKVMRR